MPSNWRNPGGVLSTSYSLTDVEGANITLTYVQLGNTAATVNTSGMIVLRRIFYAFSDCCQPGNILCLLLNVKHECCSCKIQCDQ